MGDFLNCRRCGKEWMRDRVFPGEVTFCSGCGRAFVCTRFFGWRMLSARAERRLPAQLREFIDARRIEFLRRRAP